MFINKILVIKKKKEESMLLKNKDENETKYNHFESHFF